MKNYILLIYVLLFMSSCNNNAHGQRKNDPYRTIVKAFIEYRNLGKSVPIDNQKNILLVGSNTGKRFENSYWLDISFVNPELLLDFKYSKVYEVGGYKLIMDESLDRADLLKKSFKETKYEDFNLAKMPIDYNSVSWLITFNLKNEIIHISPEQKSKEVKALLLKKGVKFSKDFEE